MNENKKSTISLIIAIISLCATVFFGLRAEKMLRFENWELDLEKIMMILGSIAGAIGVITSIVFFKRYKLVEETKHMNIHEVKPYKTIIGIVGVVLTFSFGVSEFMSACDRENSKETIETPLTQEIDSTKSKFDSKQFRVTKISVLNSKTSYIEFRYVGSNTIGNIKIELSNSIDYCLVNSFDFPIYEMYRNGTFEIQLRHLNDNNKGNVRISIKWYDNKNHRYYRELKDINIIERKVYEVDSNVQNTQDMVMTILRKQYNCLICAMEKSASDLENKVNNHLSKMGFEV